MSIKKYIKVNATFTYCFDRDEELISNNISTEIFQRETNRMKKIDFAPEEGDTCIINSVELVNE